MNTHITFRSLGWTTFIGFVFAAAMSELSATPLRYRVVDLQPLGFKAVTAINNQGHLIGTALDNGLLFYDGTQTTNYGQNQDHLAVFGYALNVHDVITGSVVDTDNNTRAMQLTAGVVTAVGTSFTDVRGVGINDAGQIVGVTQSRGAFFLDGSTRTSLDGITVGAAVYPSAINTAGQVTGSSGLSPDSYSPMRASLWANGQTKDLGTLGGANSNSSATALNDAGIVVGSSELGDPPANSEGNPSSPDQPRLGDEKPFIYSAGTMIGINLPIPSPSESWSVGAKGINNYAVVVAEADRDRNWGRVRIGAPLPFVWSGGKQMSLNDVTDFAGTTFTTIGSVFGINDRGEIIATAAGPNGDYSPVVLEPLQNGAPGQLVNMSIRGALGTGESTCIAGFVVGERSLSPGDGEVLIRGVGPGLADIPGIEHPAADPQITLFRGKTPLQSNDDWGTSADQTELAETAARVGAFALADGSKDAAMLAQVPPGPYTVMITGSDKGVVLGEVYDGDRGSGPVRLVNLSARVQVGGGEQTPIAGFVVAGDNPCRVLIRAVGPTLRQMNVTGVLNHPVLWLHAADGSPVMGNDHWGSAATFPLMVQTAQAVGAFALDDGSQDAAMLVQLEPGAYTATVTGADGDSGVVLLEIYAVPSS